MSAFDKIDKLILKSNIARDVKILDILKDVIIDLNAKRELSNQQESDLKSVGLLQNEIEELENFSPGKISALHRAVFAPSLFELKLINKESIKINKESINMKTTTLNSIRKMIKEEISKKKTINESISMAEYIAEKIASEASGKKVDEIIGLIYRNLDEKDKKSFNSATHREYWDDIIFEILGILKDQGIKYIRETKKINEGHDHGSKFNKLEIGVLKIVGCINGGPGAGWVYDNTLHFFKDGEKEYIAEIDDDVLRFDTFAKMMGHFDMFVE